MAKTQNTNNNTMSTTKHNNNTKKSSGVIRPQDFSASKLSATELKQTQDKRLKAMLLHDDAPVYMETPWVKAPFGVSSYTPEGNKDNSGKKWSLNLSATPVDQNNDEEKKLVEGFFEQLSETEEFVLKYGLENAKLVSPKTKNPSMDVMRAVFTEILKGRDTDYPVRIQPTIPKKRDDDGNVFEDSPNVTVFIEGSDEPVEIDSFETLQEHIPKGGFVKAIIMPRLWFIAGKFGLTFNVLQVLVKKRSSGRPVGYSFSDPVGESDDSDDNSGNESGDEAEDSDDAGSEAEEKDDSGDTEEAGEDDPEDSDAEDSDED